MKELKSFLSRVNCKITTQKLLEHFNEIDVRNRGELRFDDFARLYQKLLLLSAVRICPLIQFINSTYSIQQLIKKISPSW